MSHDEEQKSGLTASLAFLVGALAVIVAGLVWYAVSGGDLPAFAADEPEIQIDLPD
nr:hypothetical protein [uncultured Celeribacter sp.]